MAPISTLSSADFVFSAENLRSQYVDLHPVLTATHQAPSHVAANVLTTICDLVQGYSEFVVTGNLKGWTSWDRLHQIKVKTLILGAENDEMDPEDMKKMAAMMPNATAAICPEGSHMAFWDSQEAYFKHLLPFLHSV